MRKDEIDRVFSRIKADEGMKARIADAIADNEKNKHKINKGRCLAAIAACVAVTGVTTVFAASPAGTEPIGGIISYLSAVWIVAFIAFVIAEAITYQFITIWFAIGALGALVLSVAGATVRMQITIFLILSIATLLFLRPVSKKYLKSKTEKTNVDSLIGMDVLITEDVDNMVGAGKGKLRGMEWTVRSADNSAISAGETAIVERIEGVKLIARKEK
ncbi:MAG: NfeD family protein [Oscillospiraceae bacterium]|nr:NfeD family protein [Oscillospiraceae bacterium]